MATCRRLTISEYNNLPQGTTGYPPNPNGSPPACQCCDLPEDCTYCARYVERNERDWGTITISDAGSFTWQNPAGGDPNDGTYSLGGTYSLPYPGAGVWQNNDGLYLRFYIPSSAYISIPFSIGVIGGITVSELYGGDWPMTWCPPQSLPLSLIQQQIPDGLTINSPNTITAIWQPSADSYSACTAAGGRYENNWFSNAEQCYFYEKGLCSDPSQISVPGYSNTFGVYGESTGRCCNSQCRKPLGLPGCPAPDPSCNTDPCGPNCP